MVEDGVSPLMNAIGKSAELAANEIKALKAENAKLHAEVEHWKDNAANVNLVLTKTVEKLAVAELQF